MGGIGEVALGERLLEVDHPLGVVGELEGAGVGLRSTSRDSWFPATPMANEATDSAIASAGRDAGAPASVPVRWARASENPR